MLDLALTAKKYLEQIPQTTREYAIKIGNFVKDDPVSTTVYAFLSTIPPGSLAIGAYTAATAKDKESILAGLAAMLSGIIAGIVAGNYVITRRRMRKIDEPRSTIEFMKLGGARLEDKVIEMGDFLGDFNELDVEFDELHIFPYLDRNPWLWEPARVAAQRASRQEEFDTTLIHYRQQAGYSHIPLLDRTKVIEIEQHLF